MHGVICTQRCWRWHQKKAGERVVGQRKLATRRQEERRFSSEKQDQEQAIQRNEVRGQLLAVWERDPQPNFFCGVRQLEEHVSLRNLGDKNSQRLGIVFCEWLRMF